MSSEPEIFPYIIIASAAGVVIAAVASELNPGGREARNRRRDPQRLRGRRAHDDRHKVARPPI
jgi:hypothetical protein